MRHDLCRGNGCTKQTNKKSISIRRPSGKVQRRSIWCNKQWDFCVACVLERIPIVKETHNLFTDVAETSWGKQTKEEIKFYGEVQSTPERGPKSKYTGEWALRDGGAVSVFVQPHSLRWCWFCRRCHVGLNSVDGASCGHLSHTRGCW